MVPARGNLVLEAGKTFHFGPKFNRTNGGRKIDFLDPEVIYRTGESCSTDKIPSPEDGFHYTSFLKPRSRNKSISFQTTSQPLSKLNLFEMRGRS